MTLRDLLQTTKLGQRYQIWFAGCEILETSDLERFCNDNFIHDEVAYNLDEEIKSLTVKDGVLVLEMKCWEEVK